MIVIIITIIRCNFGSSPSLIIGTCSAGVLVWPARVAMVASGHRSGIDPWACSGGSMGLLERLTFVIALTGNADIARERRPEAPMDTHEGEEEEERGDLR